MAYVYGHYKVDTGELFYIGKGTGKRAWSKKKRNRYWYDVVANHEYEVRIIEDDLTEEQAFSREKELIAEAGLDNLVNMAEGGEGCTRADALRSQNVPEQKRILSEKSKALWSSPEFKKKRALAFARAIAEGKFKNTYKNWGQKRVDYQKRIKEDPEYRAKYIESVKRGWETRRRNKQ